MRVSGYELRGAGCGGQGVHLLSTIYYLLSTIYYLLPTIYYQLSSIYHQLTTSHHLFDVIDKLFHRIFLTGSTHGNDIHLAIFFVFLQIKNPDGRVARHFEDSLQAMILLLNLFRKFHSSRKIQFQQNHIILRSEEHTSELQSRGHLVCRLLLEKNKKKKR